MVIKTAPPVKPEHKINLGVPGFMGKYSTFRIVFNNFYLLRNHISKGRMHEICTIVIDLFIMILERKSNTLKK